MAATDHRDITSMPDLTTTAAVRSGARARAQAGDTPVDIDVVELYDAFTFNTLQILEDLDLCEKGEGGIFHEGGGIPPGGTLSVNTNGGGPPCVHPGMYREADAASYVAAQHLSANGGYTIGR